MQTLCGKPLTFGDEDQIKELHKQHAQYEKEEEHRLAKEEGQFKTYSVEISGITITTITVAALSEEDAEDKAISEFDPFNNYDDVEVLCIEEM